MENKHDFRYYIKLMRRKKKIYEEIKAKIKSSQAESKETIRDNLPLIPPDNLIKKAETI